MRIFRRVLGWATFLGFLIAVGAMVFLEVRSRPRCTIAGDYRFLQSSPDGATVVTATVLENEIPGNEAVRIGAPVQVWDTTTGEIRFTLLENVGYLDLADAALSPDHRHIAVSSPDGTIHLLDCANGVEHALRLGEHSQCGFSPGGAWMFVRTTKESPTDFVVEVATRRIVLRPRRGEMDWRDFNPNDKTALMREGAKPAIAIWDLAASKKIGSLATARGPWTEISQGGRYFLNLRLADDRARDSLGPLFHSPEFEALRPTRHPVDRLVEIWDLTTLTKCYSHVYRDHHFLESRFAANSRHAMICKPDSKNVNRLDVVDIEKRHTVLTMTMESGYHDFSPDDNLLCISSSKQRTTVVDLVSGKTVWEKPVHGAVRFAGNTGVLMYLDEKVAAKPAELLDARTGERRGVIPILARDPSAAGGGLDAALPRLTPDARRLLAVGQRQGGRYFWEAWLARWWPARFGDKAPGMVVMDTSTGGVLFQVFTSVGAHQILSHDGATLATVENSSDMRSTVIRIWDIHPGRAWTWALAVAMGTGVGLWAVRRGVGWLRGRLSKPKERVA